MKCNRNEANVYISTNINGNVKKEYLCSECAKDVNMKEFMNMDKILSRMFNSNRMLGFDNMLIPTTMHNFFKDSDMYFDSLFNDFDIKPIEKEIEDTVRIKEENRIDKKEENKKQLQYELKKAIKEERYEDAAVIRDKINGKNK